MVRGSCHISGDVSKLKENNMPKVKTKKSIRIKIKTKNRKRVKAA